MMVDGAVYMEREGESLSFTGDQSLVRVTISRRFEGADVLVTYDMLRTDVTALYEWLKRRMGDAPDSETMPEVDWFVSGKYWNQYGAGSPRTRGDRWASRRSSSATPWTS